MPRRVAVVHNFYQQAGGEDVVFESEARLLAARGHDVARCTFDNARVATMPAPQLAAATVWNGAAHAELRRVFAERRCEVAHFHNTFPLVSPAGYDAARSAGAAVVQTLHNFRLICPSAILFRDGGVCEDCVGRAVPWPGVAHACYRGSRAASGVTAAMLTLHRARGTWTRMVDVYVALTAFARDRFVAGGLPAEKIVVKPNFVDPDPGVGAHAGGYALYVGRLAPEKGIETLLRAWARLDHPYPLRIVGAGPLESAMRDLPPGAEWLGAQPRERVLSLMRDAAMLVFPSTWYETFGMTIVEAFATGLPVVASGHGSAAAIVRDGETGLHFRPGDAADLARQVGWLAAHPAERAAMGGRARAAFEAEYTAARNYDLLTGIYETAVARAAAIPRRSLTIPRAAARAAAATHEAQ